MSRARVDPDRVARFASDINQSLQRLARIGDVPESYGQCFIILAENGIITKDLATRLVRMAGFRNRLVHIYWDTDWTQVHAIIRNELGDLQEFVRQTGAATILRGCEDSEPPVTPLSSESASIDE